MFETFTAITVTLDVSDHAKYAHLHQAVLGVSIIQLIVTLRNAELGDLTWTF